MRAEIFGKEPRKDYREGDFSKMEPEVALSKR